MEQRRTPPGRYDEPRALLSGPGRTTVAIVLALALVGAGYLLFARRTATSATAAVVAYSVSSTTLISIRFEVRRPAGRKAVCFVRALDANGAEVGSADVTIAAAGPAKVQQTTLLTTSRRASTGNVGRCVLR